MPRSRCASCGAPLGLFSAESLCITCHTRDPKAARVAVPARVPTGKAWLWIAPSAARALACRDLGIILRVYRKANQLSQLRLAEQLGYDPAYISLLERGKRTITDRRSLARIACQLGIPPHILGITDDDDADFVAMLQFADSVIRLAEITRRSGRAVEAVNEPRCRSRKRTVAANRPSGSSCCQRPVRTGMSRSFLHMRESPSAPPLATFSPRNACSRPRDGRARPSTLPEGWMSLLCWLMSCACTATNYERPDMPKPAPRGLCGLVSQSRSTNSPRS